MIKIITQPSVFLLGAQTTNDAELDRFLADHGVSWKSDSEVAAEVLSETAGRVCYMSFAKPRPGGNSAYLHHIKEVGHGSVLEHAVWNFLITGVSRTLTHELVRHRAGWGYCLAGDVEVFSGSKLNGTFDGVKKRWTIKQLYDWSIDPKRKGRIKLITVRCFDGVRFVSAKIKKVVQSGVKRIFEITLLDGKKIKSSADHRFLTPTGWESVRNLQAGNCVGTNGLPVIDIPESKLKDLYHDKGKNLTEIAGEFNCSTHTVRKKLKAFNLQKAQGQGMKGRTPPNKGTTYTTGYRHSEATRQKLGEQKRGENNPQWQGDLASQQAGRMRAQKLFKSEPCERCGKAEGDRHHKDKNTLNNHRDNIEFLCKSCHTRHHIETDGHPNALTVKWVGIASIRFVGEEMTYDLEVDHEAHNFVANGFVTHNSQLSQRYVDESVAEYVEPDIIAADPEMHAVWMESVAHSHRAYVKLSKMLNERLADPAAAAAAMIPVSADRTTKQKAARQAARSVLPNATETKVFVTANARALRHFLEQRGSRHAEPEIRKLANAVHAMMAEASPNLFGDYRRVELPDGTYELQTDFPKV